MVTYCNLSEKHMAILLSSDEYKHGFAVPNISPVHTCMYSLSTGQEYREPLIASSCVHTQQL